MAIARICDACGKYYNEAECQGQTILVSDLVPKRVVEKRLGFYTDPRTNGIVHVSYPKKLNLCNACYESIVNLNDDTETKEE